MKRIKQTQCRYGHPAARTRCSGPQIEDRLGSLIKAACDARAGAAQMTLNEWCELELELKERLQNEHATIQR
jgi:hypothetical protein